MPFHERGPVGIHYEEAGSGFPLLLIPGGGLNSAIYPWKDSQAHIDEVVEHARRFPPAHVPARA